MALAKLTIIPEESLGSFPNEGVVALFNPEQITIQKSTKWKLSPRRESDTSASQFTHGEPATLSMDLFFDTYSNPDVSDYGIDVRQYTRRIFALTTIEQHGELHRPPLCRIVWGSFNISDEFQCNWILQSLNQRFTMFLEDGTPVRAILSTTFKQWRGDEEEKRILDLTSSDLVKTRVFRMGERLSDIAHQEYGDSGLWRIIADASRIDDPRSLKPGIILTVPPLPSLDKRKEWK